MTRVLWSTVGTYRLLMKTIDPRKPKYNISNVLLFNLQIQITCFQSINEGSTQSRKEIKLEIINNNDPLLSNNFEVSI